MEELKLLAEKLQDSKKYNFTKLADVINNYISNKSKDVNMIEYYLDYLIDCIYDDNSLKYACDVCDYLEKLDEVSGNLYRTTLNKYYSECKKKIMR